MPPLVILVHPRSMRVAVVVIVLAVWVVIVVVIFILFLSAYVLLCFPRFLPHIVASISKPSTRRMAGKHSRGKGFCYDFDLLLVRYRLAVDSYRMEKLILAQWASLKLFGKFINTVEARTYELVGIKRCGKNGAFLMLQG